MDTVLIAVAALSLAMAIGMAFMVAKLLRDDRARSEARVAALSAMAAEPAPAVEVMRVQRTAQPGLRAPASEASASRVQVHEPSGSRAPGPEAPESRARAQEPPVAARTAPPITHLHGTMSRAAQLDDLEIRPPQPAAARAADLFAERDQPSLWGPRLAVIGMLVAGLAVIGFAMTSSVARRNVAGSASVSATNAPAAENPPLELLSLRHAQQAQSLTITGLVRNPRGAAPLSRVVATAFIFAPDGTFLASSRASLDFTTLAPGDESPFVVTVPVTGEVSRYRIGFRAEDGRVIAHVDKRAPDALASTSPR
jgi:hypothetical protein